MKSKNIHLQKHLMSSWMSKSVSQIELCTSVFAHAGMHRWKQSQQTYLASSAVWIDLYLVGYRLVWRHGLKWILHADSSTMCVILRGGLIDLSCRNGTLKISSITEIQIGIEQTLNTQANLRSWFFCFVFVPNTLDCPPFNSDRQGRTKSWWRWDLKFLLPVNFTTLQRA